MIPRVLVLALLVVTTAAAQSTQNKVGDAVHVTSTVSRTAIWVGDHVDFTVEFSLAPQVAVMPDDLVKEKLPLEGLEVVSTSSERRPADGGRVIERYHYVLSSYDSAQTTLKVGSWPVRYYMQRPGERPEDVSPAGEVQIPAAAIARRSTLPDEITSLDVRAEGAPADAPRFLGNARAAGLGLILLAAAPLAVWTTVMASRWRSRVRKPRRSAVRAQAMSVLEELRAADIDSGPARREAYGRLERAVRQHFAAMREIPAHALVSSELATRLRAAGSAHADTAGDLLAECERVRYGPPDRLPPKERFTTALEAAEGLFSGALR